MRWFFALILCLLAPGLAAAQTGTAKTKAALAAEIAGCFPDQMTGAITPQIMRQCTLDFVASWQQYTGVNSQPGTTYAVQPSDTGQMITTTASSPIAVSLPSAGATGFYPFNFWITAIGTGTITITPAVGTIAGQPFITISTNQAAFITSDGTNWQAIQFSGGTAINITGGLAGSLGYYASTGTVISPLTQCNSGVFGTDSGGIAQCVTTLPPALTYPSPVFSGTATGPDGGTWGTRGLNGVGIGLTLASNAVFANLGFTTLSPTSLQNSPITITGLTANNSPDAANDYLLYFNHTDNLIRKITVATVSSAGVAGVGSLSGLNGTLSLAGSGGMTISAVSPTITLIVPVVLGGRLTLTSGTPVMTASQTNASTIYYDCYHGGRTAPVFDGTNDVNLIIGVPVGACEISTALQSSSTGVINSGDVFDVWAINNSSALMLCVATNGSGGGWASDTGGSVTARGTGYSQLDSTTRPYITNANALTHCYNGATDKGTVAAHQATYLGTFYSTAAGQTSFTFGTRPTVGTVVSGLFGLWNAYNRVRVVSDLWPSQTTWVYNTGPEPVRSSTLISHQYVYGLNEDGVIAHLMVGNITSGSGTGFSICQNGIGVDTITAFTSGISVYGSTAGTGIPGNNSSTYAGNPGVGLHTVTGMQANPSATASCAAAGGGTLGGLTIDLRM